MNLIPQLSPTRFRVATNTLSQLIGKFVNSGATFIVSILIARSFGAFGYGDFVKITTYIAYFYLLTDFGLNAIYLQKQENDDKLWGTLLGTRLIGSVFFIFIALSLLAFLPPGSSQGYTASVRLGIILFSPSIIAQAIITTTNALFQKHLRYDLASLALGAGSLVSLLLIWLVTQLFQTQVGPVFASLASLIGIVVSAITSLVLAFRLEKPHISFQVKSMTPLLVASLPLGLTLLFNQIYFRADSFILTLTRATTDVGIYGLAYKLFEMPLAIPTFVMNSAYPILLKKSLQRKQEDKGANFSQTVFRLSWALLLVSLLLVVVLWFFAPLITYIRPEFVASVESFRILLLGLPFFFLSSLTMWVLISLKKQLYLLGVYGLSMIATVIADVIFIPTNGYIAAAWITVISEGLVFIVSVFVLTHLFAKDGKLFINPTRII